LEKALQETDVTTTDVVVMTAKVRPRGDMAMHRVDLDTYDQTLMTSVVTRAETSGKPVTPLIVPTNNPFFAVIQTAKTLEAQELIIGASNKFGADEQLEQVAFYWMNLCEGSPQPLTVRILSHDRDVYLDIEGGNRIPKFGEAGAHSIAELRAAGIGVHHVLFVYLNTLESSALFETILTMLDPQVTLSVAQPTASSQPAEDWLQRDLARAKQLHRQVDLLDPGGNDADAIVQVARQQHADLIIISASSYAEEPSAIDVDWVVRHSPCRICVITPPRIPHETVP
jgi:nucleotide-binding universal stress UspA family protein